MEIHEQQFLKERSRAGKGFKLMALSDTEKLLDLNFLPYRKSLIGLSPQSRGCPVLHVAALDGIRLSTCLQPWLPFIYPSTSKQAIHLSSCQHPAGPFICKNTGNSGKQRAWLCGKVIKSPAGTSKAH